ncbi:putative G-patch domain protein [Xylona heveae TC161]|uniref:Putative G-patch domain protein n=1 Tax=Xylona heveae (strain CBS 132557 / TC161) TaxID=1328760 RepID=A0A165HB80_XYLHT|nr:putative G-patch domain protein [Xylona heveae TC161]KZF23245.1 putative G-patch domain protein [Xylona heveae TC161]
MNEDEEYFVPLQDQRYFGAGIKRQRVQFVRANSAEATVQPPRQNAPSSSVGDRYLSIVLPKSAPVTPPNGGTEREELEPANDQEEIPKTCEICHLPLNPESSAESHNTPHETSIAHQVCLEHSHPPSHLDRGRLGLKYLSSYGWDPDSRQGLGSKGEGILNPLKGKVKNDTVGLGVKFSKDPKVNAAQKKPAAKLNAKQVRQQEEEGKKRRARLQEMFYRNEDLEKYLGPAA